MAKPNAGRRARVRREPAKPTPDRPVIVEDVDGNTCVVRAFAPLDEGQRSRLAYFVEVLLLDDEREIVDVELPDEDQLAPTEGAWLERPPPTELGAVDWIRLALVVAFVAWCAFVVKVAITWLS